MADGSSDKLTCFRSGFYVSHFLEDAESTLTGMVQMVLGKTTSSFTLGRVDYDLMRAENALLETKDCTDQFWRNEALGAIQRGREEVRRAIDQHLSVLTVVDAIEFDIRKAAAASQVA